MQLLKLNPGSLPFGWIKSNYLLPFFCSEKLSYPGYHFFFFFEVLEFELRANLHLEPLHQPYFCDGVF
jgi:hypothetical protein